MQRLPFVTQNTSLALALQSVGVPLLEVWNVYDAAILKRLGMESARIAKQCGLPGSISYFLEHIEGMERLLDAYDSASKQWTDNTLEEMECSPEDAMRIACVILKKRPEFAALWKAQIPKYMESKGDFVRSGDDAEGTITSPGFKLVSINASDEIRSKLDL